MHFKDQMQQAFARKIGARMTKEAKILMTPYQEELNKQIERMKQKVDDMQDNNDELNECLPAGILEQQFKQVVSAQRRQKKMDSELRLASNPQFEPELKEFAGELWMSLAEFEDNLRDKELGIEIQLRNQNLQFNKRVQYIKKTTSFRMEALESALSETKLKMSRETDRALMYASDMESYLLNKEVDEKSMEKMESETDLIMQNALEFTQQTGQGFNKKHCQEQSRLMMKLINDLKKSNESQKYDKIGLNQQIANVKHQMEQQKAFVETSASNQKQSLLMVRFYQQFLIRIINKSNFFEKLGETSEEDRLLFEQINRIKEQYAIQDAEINNSIAEGLQKADPVKGTRRLQHYIQDLHQIMKMVKIDCLFESYQAVMQSREQLMDQMVSELKESGMVTEGNNLQDNVTVQQQQLEFLLKRKMQHQQYRVDKELSQGIQPTLEQPEQADRTQKAVITQIANMMQTPIRKMVEKKIEKMEEINQNKRQKVKNKKEGRQKQNEEQKIKNQKIQHGKNRKIEQQVQEDSEDLMSEEEELYQKEVFRRELQKKQLAQQEEHEKEQEVVNETREKIEQKGIKQMQLERHKSSFKNKKIEKMKSFRNKSPHKGKRNKTEAPQSRGQSIEKKTLQSSRPHTPRSKVTVKEKNQIIVPTLPTNQSQKSGSQYSNASCSIITDQLEMSSLVNSRQNLTKDQQKQKSKVPKKQKIFEDQQQCLQPEIPQSEVNISEQDQINTHSKQQDEFQYKNTPKIKPRHRPQSDQHIDSFSNLAKQNNQLDDSQSNSSKQNNQFDETQSKFAKKKYEHDDRQANFGKKNKEPNDPQSKSARKNNQPDDPKSKSARKNNQLDKTQQNLAKNNKKLNKTQQNFAKHNNNHLDDPQQNLAKDSDSESNVNQNDESQNVQKYRSKHRDNNPISKQKQRQPEFSEKKLKSKKQAKSMNPDQISSLKEQRQMNVNRGRFSELNERPAKTQNECIDMSASEQKRCKKQYDEQQRRATSPDMLESIKESESTEYDMKEKLVEMMRDHVITMIKRENPEESIEDWDDQTFDELLSYNMQKVHRSMEDEDSQDEGMQVIDYFETLMSTIEDKMIMNVPEHQKEHLDIYKLVWDGENMKGRKATNTESDTEMEEELNQWKTKADQSLATDNSQAKRTAKEDAIAIEIDTMIGEGLDKTIQKLQDFVTVNKVNRMLDEKAILLKKLSHFDKRFKVNSQEEKTVQNIHRKEVVKILREDVKSTIDILRQSIAENREFLNKEHLKTTTSLNEVRGCITSENSPEKTVRFKNSKLPCLEPLTKQVYQTVEYESENQSSKSPKAQKQPFKQVSQRLNNIQQARSLNKSLNIDFSNVPNNILQGTKIRDSEIEFQAISPKQVNATVINQDPSDNTIITSKNSLGYKVTLTNFPSLSQTMASEFRSTVKSSLWRDKNVTLAQKIDMNNMWPYQDLLDKNPSHPGTTTRTRMVRDGLKEKNMFMKSVDVSNLNANSHKEVQKFLRQPIIPKATKFQEDKFHCFQRKSKANISPKILNAFTSKTQSRDTSLSYLDLRLNSEESRHERYPHERSSCNTSELQANQHTISINLPTTASPQATDNDK